MTSVPTRSMASRWLGRVLAGGVCALALGAASMAQARDVNWTIGISSPGVSVGVSNNQPVVVYPQPVYVQPQPVYQVRPVPGYVQPVVVYPQPAAVWGPPGHRKWHKEHHRHGHDRWDRDDDRRRWR